MNILVSNDDGFDAKGINILFSVLQNFGHKVFMVAPHKNCSAISNGITMKDNLVLKYISKNQWSCTGKPADCVITAIKSSLIHEKIDMIISGINDGENLGTDIIYSGTCAAARQGALYKIPSVAVSLCFFDRNKKSHFVDCYTRMAEFVCKNLDSFKSFLQKIDCKAFVNINAHDTDSWKGAKLTSVLSKRHYEDKVELSKIDDLNTECKFIGMEPESSQELKSDFYACKNGYISVSFVQVEPNTIQVIDDIDFSL